MIHSATVGKAPWSRVLVAGVGKAGIYAPPDLGPNVNGVIAEGASETPQWVYADLDLSALDRLRRGDGVIANEEEWDSHLTFSQVSPVTYQAAAKHDHFA